MFADGGCCVRRGSPPLALIPFRWAVCKKCVREVTRDRVLRDRRIVLSTCRCEGSCFFVAWAMDS